MIELVKKSEHGYAARGVAVKVLHGLEGSDIKDLLSILIAERGISYAEELIREVGLFQETARPNNNGYMCAVEGAGAPRYTHERLDSAVCEGEKLAKRHKKNVMILARVCTVTTKLVETVTTTIRNP